MTPRDRAGIRQAQNSTRLQNLGQTPLHPRVQNERVTDCCISEQEHHVTLSARQPDFQLLKGGSRHQTWLSQSSMCCKGGLGPSHPVPLCTPRVHL